MNRFTLPVIIEKDKDGYFAFCPDLQGCYTQGDSYEEVLNNIEDAIRLYIEDCLENGESIPISEEATEMLELQKKLAKLGVWLTECEEVANLWEGEFDSSADLRRIRD